MGHLHPAGSARRPGSSFPASLSSLNLLSNQHKHPQTTILTHPQPECRLSSRETRTRCVCAVIVSLCAHPNPFVVSSTLFRPMSTQKKRRGKSKAPAAPNAPPPKERVPYPPLFVPRPAHLHMPPSPLTPTPHPSRGMELAVKIEALREARKRVALSRTSLPSCNMFTFFNAQNMFVDKTTSTPPRLPLSFSPPLPSLPFPRPPSPASTPCACRQTAR